MAPANDEVRLDVATPQSVDPASFALSPDGKLLVYAATEETGQLRLWMRPLDNDTARPANVASAVLLS